MSKAQRLSGAIAFLLVMVCLGNAQTSTINWNTGPSLLSPRDSGAAAVISDGTIYVLGGNSSSPLSFESLPPDGVAWAAAGQLLAARLGPGATAQGSVVYISGGKINNRAVKDLNIYNPGINTITGLPSMSTPRYLHAYAASPGILYAIGGLDDKNVPTAQTESFSPATGRWTRLVALPEARSNFAAIYAGGQILTFGGSTAASIATGNVYRFSSTAWLPLAPLPVATNGSAVVAGANNLVYVIGGVTTDGARTNAVQIYHTDTNTWTVGTPLPVAVTNASAVIDSAGNIFVIGGTTAANVNVSTVWKSAQESAAPVINLIPGNAAVAGAAFSYQVTSSGNPAPTFSLPISPDGMTIDSTTGLLSWTPALTQTGAQNVTVRAVNASGNNDQSFTISVAPPAPVNFVATDITANTATLSWDAYPAAGGPATYDLYECFRGSRGGCNQSPLSLGLTSPTVTLSGLAAGSSHVYRLYNNVGGLQSAFVAIVVSTLQPATPNNFMVAGMTQNSVTMSWTAPVNSQVPVVGYRIIELIVPTGVPIIRVDNVTGTTATVTGLLANSTHIFYVVALDADLNQSFPSGLLSVTTSSLPVLFHNPAFPRAVGGGFNAETLAAVSGDRLMLVSQEAQSATGLDYVISGSGLPAPTFSLVSAPPGMTIDPITGVVTWNTVNSAPGTFTAIARGTNVEGSGDFSFNYTVYPAGTDLLSPVPVQTIASTATNITRTSATITWLATTDNVGIAGYRIFAVTPVTVCGRNGFCPPLPVVAPLAVVNGTGTTVTLTGLMRNTGYTFWVQAFDAAGNTSFITLSQQRSFTTLN